MVSLSTVATTANRLLATGVCLLALTPAACDIPPDFEGGDSSASLDAGTPDVPVTRVDAAPDGAGVTDAGDTAATGDAGAGDGGGTDNLPDYSFVVLPDTQYYSSSWPDIFMKQTSWIVEKHDDLDIAFVLHTGDLVDSDSPPQWQVASNSLHQLDGIVPYVIAAGNHDYGHLADRMGMANIYFPPSSFEPYPWFGGTFEPGHIENNFSLLNAGGTRWLVISLEFGARDEALAWASSILKIFSGRPAIIITHAYLYRDSTRYNAATPQYFNPHSYNWMSQMPTTVNDGEEIWRKLILPNRNVKLVFSGHDVNFGDLPPGTTGRLTSARPDGSVVHQILANYQTCLGPPCTTSDQGTIAHGGNGYLRIVRMSPGQRKIYVTTYSPYVDRWLDDANNQFDLDLN